MSKFPQIFNRGLFGATLMCALAFSAGVHARSLNEDDIRYCAAFASKAMELQNVIKERGCSFPPSPRLTDKYMQRYEWCTAKLRGDPSIAWPGFGIEGLSDVDWEYQTMLTMIGQCKALSRENDEPDKRATCDAYADEAVKYATEFRRNNCFVAPEFDGRYSLNREEHFNWCLYSATREGWSNERRARYNETKQCTKGVQCRTYAKDAVSVAKQYKQKGCKEDAAYEGHASPLSSGQRALI